MSKGQWLVDSLKNGLIPISYETVPARGIAKNGPIARYKMTENPIPNAGWTRDAIACRSRSPEYAKARIASNGRPTPVTRKPALATQTCSPASCPSIGGKMRFPAPKNKAKSIMPMTMINDVGTVLDIINPH